MTTLPIRQSNQTSEVPRHQAGPGAGFVLCLLLVASQAAAVPILDDPNGFEDMPWGTIISETGPFVKVEDAGRLQTFEKKDTPPALGATPVDSLRFTTFQSKFGRVTVRYSGKAAHEGIMTYLQAKYGPLDRTPGQIAVGPVKVYAWHGFDTEVTLRYETKFERGIIFFESRTLREKLSEGSSGTVF